MTIHLQPSMITRKSQWIDAEVSETLFSLDPYQKDKDEKIPVAGYDPVQCYLQDLEVHIIYYFELGFKGDWVC